MSAPYIVVGRDIAARNPSLACGPFATREEAEEFRADIEKASTGVYFVLTLFAIEEKKTEK